MLLLLSLLSLCDLHFVYPTRAPRWKGLFLGGSWAWSVVLWEFERRAAVSGWLLALSLIYPLLYLLLSFYLDLQRRQEGGHARRQPR